LSTIASPWPRELSSRDDKLSFKHHRVALAETVGLADGTVWVYGSVSRAYESLMRIKDLTFKHHQVAMAVEGEALAAEAGFEYQYVRVYGVVSRAYEPLIRINGLQFLHHRVAMAAPTLEKRLEWLGSTTARCGSTARCHAPMKPHRAMRI
jgi:hypothetical protein